VRANYNSSNISSNAIEYSVYLEIILLSAFVGTAIGICTKAILKLVSD